MIPILKIKRFVDLLVEFIRTDYENAVDKNKSFMYTILGDHSEDGWNFFNNAVEIFSRDASDMRKLETRLMFDRSRAAIPTIHVREPAKNNGGYDSIGFMSGERTENEDGTYSDLYRKTHSSRFELMITSGNSLECILIQELIESAILSAIDTLIIPFDIINISSKELMMESNIEQNMLFIKSIDLEIKYEKTLVPTLYTEANITSITFNNSTLLEI